MSVFATKKQPKKGTAAFMTRVEEQVQRQGGNFVNKDRIKSVLSHESISAADQADLVTTQLGLRATLESLAAETGVSFTDAAMDAATYAGMIASNPAAHFGQTLSVESTAVANPTGMAKMADRALSLESYDSTPNTNYIKTAIAYNLEAARQDPFGEAFYSTITLAPDQSGLDISIRINSVQSEVTRSLSGKVQDFGRHNLLDVPLNPEILKNNVTDAIPVVTDENKAFFVDEALITPFEVKSGPDTVLTSYLATGRTSDYMALCQKETLIKNGALDFTDALDPTVELSDIAVRIPGATAADTEVISFHTAGLMYSNFMATQQGNTNQVTLNFTNTSLRVNKNTKLVNGGTSKLLKVIQDNNLSVRIKLEYSGNLKRDTGENNLYGSNPQVTAVYNEDGVKLTETDPLFVAVARIFEGSQIIGHRLKARFINSNVRVRGKMIDSNYYTQTYQTYLRAPFTKVRSLIDNMQEDDAAVIQDLITVTRQATSLDAVDSLLAYADVLDGIVNDGNYASDQPQVKGVASSLVKSYFRRIEFDVAEAIDSLSSSDRLEDLQALLINKMRELATDAYATSNYKTVLEALTGQVDVKPKVTIGTHTILANWMMTSGDPRTMGAGFDYEVVSTQNIKMKDKIVMVFSPNQEGEQFNALNFGHMLWKPELPYTLPVPRTGGVSKETSVQPSYNHINNCPVMIVIEVKNLPEAVVGKTFIKTKQM